MLLCRAYGKSGGSGYAPPKARSHPAAEGRVPFAMTEDEDEREDAPLVKTRGSGLDSFFSEMEKPSYALVRLWHRVDFPEERSYYAASSLSPLT